MGDDDSRQQAQSARIPGPRDRRDTGSGTPDGQDASGTEDTSAAVDAADTRSGDEPERDVPADRDGSVPEEVGPGEDARAVTGTDGGPNVDTGPTEQDTDDTDDTGDSDDSDDSGTDDAGHTGEAAEGTDPGAVTGGGDTDAPPTDVDAGEDTDGSARRRQRPARRGAAGVRASVLIGVLFALLGFGLAVQVRTTSSTSGLSSARQEDLVRILDDLSSREDRLRQQIASLEAARSKLLTSGDKASVALSEARNRSATLGILSGTVPARGPGVRLTLNDPGHRLDSEDLLDAVEELRAAGAEAFQVGPVRIGVSSAFSDEHGGVLADGVRLDPPYVILAIGDPGTLATALNIPGGVVASVRNAGGQAVVEQRQQLVIDAVRPVLTPEHASPAPTGDN